MTIFVMVGIPGSGKSTYSKKLEDTGAVHISLDEIRNKQMEETGTVNEKYIFSEGLNQLRKALNDGKDVICDSTNVYPSKRAVYLKEAKKYKAKCVAVFINTDKKTCLERNNLRKGNAKVPAVAIHTLAKKLVPPTVEEGFDLVIML